MPEPTLAEIMAYGRELARLEREYLRLRGVPMLVGIADFPTFLESEPSVGDLGDEE